MSKKTLKDGIFLLSLLAFPAFTLNALATPVISNARLAKLDKPGLKKQELQFSSSVIHLASYDVQQRIKELGGGPFCINPRIDEWVNGMPRQLKPTPDGESCAEWRAGHMSSDRRWKAGVTSCTCRE